VRERNEVRGEGSGVVETRGRREKELKRACGEG